MKQNIRVAMWGFGAMGSGIAEVLCRKQGVEITGVCIHNAAREGKSMYQLLGIERGDRPEVLLTTDISKVVYPGAADICVVATDSFTRDVFPKIRYVCEQGVNVVSIAEEMSFPAAKEPELAAELDKVAREHGVSILGTGINPGLMMDLLAVCLSGCMTDVEKVTCRRVNSLSPFGPLVMKEQGIGVTAEQFEKGVSDGSLAGHVGFAESVAMIDKALCMGVNGFCQQMKPIITSVDRKSPYGFAKAGDVAGVNMTGQGTKDGEVVIDMYHPQQIEPELEGTHTGDYIVLEGTPAVSMAIQPEVNGGIGTIAMCVNMIPHVINARPGLKTMLDLPVPHAIMGDFRDYIEE